MTNRKHEDEKSVILEMYGGPIRKASVLTPKVEKEYGYSGAQPCDEAIQETMFYFALLLHVKSL